MTWSGPTPAQSREVIHHLVRALGDIANPPRRGGPASVVAARKIASEALRDMPRRYMPDDQGALLDRLAALEAAVGEQRHIVDIAESDFGLQHPIECRDDLLGCEIGVALHALEGPPRPVGRYVVSWAPDGSLLFEVPT